MPVDGTGNQNERRKSEKRMQQEGTKKSWVLVTCIVGQKTFERKSSTFRTETVGERLGVASSDMKNKHVFMEDLFRQLTTDFNSKISNRSLIADEIGVD